MGQFVGCVRGIAEACRTLDFPVVSGNVSLYNETNGQAIPPTPTIGGVGLLNDFACSATVAFKTADEAILLVGCSQGWLGQSVYLRDVCGREEGAPPPVDLAAEKRNGDFVRTLIERRIATAVHDISDGGLAVAVAEMAMASRIGADLRTAPTGSLPPAAFWFGEDQARYVVTVRDSDVAAVLKLADAGEVPVTRIGVTGGTTLLLRDERPMPVRSLSERFESWFPGYMEQLQTEA
jgi:phosphoribosylformylglycinamidine synthase